MPCHEPEHLSRRRDGGGQLLQRREVEVRRHLEGNDLGLTEGRAVVGAGAVDATGEGDRKQAANGAARDVGDVDRAQAPAACAASRNADRARCAGAEHAVGVDCVAEDDNPGQSAVGRLDALGLAVERHVGVGLDAFDRGQCLVAEVLTGNGLQQAGQSRGIDAHSVEVDNLAVAAGLDLVAVTLERTERCRRPGVDDVVHSQAV